MKKFKEYLYCIIGALFVAIGVYFFKFPNHFSTGGVSGISIILSSYFQIASAEKIMFMINMVLLIIGFMLCGRECGLKTFIGSMTLSGALLVLEQVCPIAQPLTDQPFLELIYAVLFPAVGSALLFNSGGSTGGTDIVALVLRKYTSLNIGTALLVSDIAITLGAFVFGPEIGLFSLLGLTIKSVAIDSIIENINLCKCFTIITDNPDEISSFIINQLKRSTTIMEATGGYSHNKTHIVISAMNRLQAVQLQRFLKTNFPASFMMVSDSSEIIGKGFRGL